MEKGKVYQMNADGSSLVESLPTRIQARERQAFLDFAEEFHVLFYRFFLSRGLPPFEAEDLTQSSMTDIPMKVIMGMYRERSDASFAAWVTRLMKVSAIDWWRNHYKHPIEVLPDDLASPDSEEIAPDVVQVIAVQDAIRQLVPAHREVIELHDLGEVRNYQEIGTLLGISPEAARVRHHRAMKALEKILKDDPRICFRSSPSM